MEMFEQEKKFADLCCQATEKQLLIHIATVLYIKDKETQEDQCNLLKSIVGEKKSPTKWEELTTEQQQKVCELAYEDTYGDTVWTEKQIKNWFEADPHSFDFGGN